MINLSVLLFLLFPALIIALCIRLPILDKLGAVLIAFGSGIFFSAATQMFWEDLRPFLLPIQTQTTEITIALAIPLLVFSANLGKAIKTAGATTKSMLVALATVMLMSALLAFAFNGHIDKLWQVAGMSVGAYTGGGPNMAAIKTAIDADDAVFVTMTTYDILLSAIYLFFVISFAKPIFSRFLTNFEHLTTNTTRTDKSFDHLGDESARAYLVLLNSQGLKETVKSLGYAALCVISSVLIAELLPESMRSTAVIILITSAGLGLSFVPAVHALKRSFQLGMYLILIFCFTMGTMTDLNILTQLDLALFAYIGLLLLGSLLIHACMCRWFKIDTDTFLITSSAAIMSVPFIPVIAGALKNKTLILPGFAAAIIGYALGNYLGVIMAYLVKWLLAA